MRSVLSVLSLAVVTGCSNSVAPGSIDGRWAEPFTVPGNSFQMDLAANGSTVSGTGTWSGEACCGGTLAVSGTIDGDKVHLDISIFQSSGGLIGATNYSHFDGKLILNRVLQGTVKSRDPANSNGQPISYVRVQS